MLESGEIPELCRNGKGKSPSPIQQIKSLEQEQTSLPPSLEYEGIFMAAAAAEQLTIDLVYASPENELVRPVSELPEDVQTREQARRFIWAATKAGEIAVEQTVEEPRYKPIESLYDALITANESNDADAHQLIYTNIKTDVIERTIKSGHVMKVDLCVDEAGKIQQFGQSMESVQANSLRFAAGSWQMRERTEAETTNAFRIQAAYEAGELDDHSLVVFSLAADNMEIDEMQEAGFFTQTMSCAIQVTTAAGGKLTTESAFVAGIKAEGEKRHDLDTVVEVGRRLGVNYEDKGAAQILSQPILIPNELLPNGAIDLVKLWDEAAGGTFFGEDRPAEDYQDYRLKCATREATYEPKILAIKQELLERTAEINNRVEATKMLAKLSGKNMVEQALSDRTIDSRVFGSIAAEHIEQARKHLERGDDDAAKIEAARAIRTETSSSCPSGGSKNELNLEGKTGEDKYGSLQFKCPKGHTNTRPRNQLISNCRTCGVSVKC